MVNTKSEERGAFLFAMALEYAAAVRAEKAGHRKPKRLAPRTAK
jgi:hypothetical protein